MAFESRSAPDVSLPPASQIGSLREYGSVYALLMLLFGASLLSSRAPGPVGAIAVVAIAVVQALLIALSYMHIPRGSKLVWLVAGAGLYWLSLLWVLTLSDYASRGWMPSTGR